MENIQIFWESNKYYFWNWMGQFFSGIAILVLGWWLVNKLCKAMVIILRKSVSDESAISFLNSAAKFSARTILILLFISIGLNFKNETLMSIFTAIGASVVAIGVLFKESISNMTSGLILIFTKPIHIGDYIEIDGIKGMVVKIEMLFTTLQIKETGKIAVIPNSKLICNNIIRESEYNSECKEFIFESKKFSNKYSEFHKFLEKEIILNDKILQIPAPTIEIIPQKDVSVRIHIKVWAQNQYIKELDSKLIKIIEKLSKKYGVVFEKLK